MILYRYIIREMIFPFLVSLCIIVFLFIMQQMVLLLEKIFSKGLDPAIVAEIFIIQLGWIIALAIPMAILIATLWTFGRMSGDNEITSIKASGQSLFPIMVPVFVAALILAVLLIFFNDQILPDANHRTANLFSDISRKRPAAFIEPGVLIKDFSGYTLHTREVDPRTGLLKEVRIFTNDPMQDPSITTADSGKIRMTPDEQYLELTLFNGETHSTSRKNPTEYFVGKFEQQLICIKNVNSQMERTNSSYRGDREKSSSMMLSDVEELKKSNEQILLEFNAVIDTARKFVKRLDSLKTAGLDSIDTVKIADTTRFSSWISLLKNNNAISTRETKEQGEYVERLLRRKRSNDLQISQYMVEVHKKYAIPVACLVFVLIGAPLGIMARRGGLTIGASYSLLFFIINWVCLIGGETLADKLIIPPAIAMWSGNVIVGVFGMILMILMLRETTINYTFFIGWWQSLMGKEQKVMKQISSLWIFKIPGIVFWMPRWIIRKFIGILPTYFLGMFSAYTAGLLIAVTSIFAILDYISNLKRFQNVQLQYIGLYYWYFLPWIIQIILPIALLLASMFALGKMAKNSELIAMKSAGINIRQLTSPLLLIGLLLSVGVFYGAEMFLPTANLKRRELLDNIRQGINPSVSSKASGIREFRRDFYYFGNPQTVYVFEEFSTAPQNAQGVQRETFGKGMISERLSAEKMVYNDSTSEWFFINGNRKNFAFEPARTTHFDTLKDTILSVTPVEMVARIKGKEEMSYWELKRFIEACKKRGEKVQEYLGELEFKLALPFMNFIVILLGVSITARTGKKGGAVLFAVGLGLMITYWILSRVSIVIAQNGHIPIIAGAWASNVLYLLLGLYLYRKAVK
ncbi:MAG TPA: LptF/LptG family permease [Chitinispirillaceae bacterium]|nr:LptF/LptG family permease [Chitinispirillaceae bacterium]